VSDVQQETCYCYSIVRDDKGRLQCLKHGDVTGRHGDERIGKVRLDQWKGWKQRVD